jgi:cohesin loading factor subunit SCC2
VKEFDRLLVTYRDVASHLCKRSSEDQAYDVIGLSVHGDVPWLTIEQQSARELTAATVGQELAAALKQVNTWISDPDADEDLNLKDMSQLPAFGTKIKNALRAVWKDPSTDVFDIGYEFTRSAWLLQSHSGYTIDHRKKLFALTDSLKRLGRYRVFATLSSQS